MLLNRSSVLCQRVLHCICHDLPWSICEVHIWAWLPFYWTCLYMESCQSLLMLFHDYVFLLSWLYLEIMLMFYALSKDVVSYTCHHDWRHHCVVINPSSINIEPQRVTLCWNITKQKDVFCLAFENKVPWKTFIVSCLLCSAFWVQNLACRDTCK